MSPRRAAHGRAPFSQGIVASAASSVRPIEWLSEPLVSSSTAFSPVSVKTRLSEIRLPPALGPFSFTPRKLNSSSSVIARIESGLAVLGIVTCGSSHGAPSRRSNRCCATSRPPPDSRAARGHRPAAHARPRDPGGGDDVVEHLDPPAVRDVVKRPLEPWSPLRLRHPFFTSLAQLLVGVFGLRPTDARCGCGGGQQLTGAWSLGQPSDVVGEAVGHPPVCCQHEQRLFVFAPEHASEAG